MHLMMFRFTPKETYMSTLAKKELWARGVGGEISIMNVGQIVYTKWGVVLFPCKNK